MSEYCRTGEEKMDIPYDIQVLAWIKHIDCTDTNDLGVVGLGRVKLMVLLGSLRSWLVRVICVASIHPSILKTVTNSG